ncbi:MAG: hypothetical protein CMC63_01385 [Flavobacteriaceae bacterium]|jgi:hypothetical protein|nr:hypothetical protein [Flavobacteriaceae bacterium]
MIYKLKKIFILFCLLFLTKVFSQWEYKENKSARSIEAIGQLNFNNSNQDSLVLRISKSKKLGLNFSINGIFFKEAQDYYVLFEISERKFKAANSITENESYQIFEVKDLISNETYELEDFFKILKKGEACTITIRSKNRVIQAYNELTGSSFVINNVLRNKFP